MKKRNIYLSLLATSLLLGTPFISGCYGGNQDNSSTVITGASKLVIKENLDTNIIDIELDKTSARYNETFVIFTTLKEGFKPEYSFFGASNALKDVTYKDTLSKVEVNETNKEITYIDYFIMPTLEGKEEILTIEVKALEIVK